MTRYNIFIPATIIALILLCATAAASGADLVIDPGTITAESPLVPGRSYTLPVHKVTNNSFRALAMTVSVSDHLDGQRELPPAGWFSIDREELTVQGCSSEDVQVEVNLPGSAPAGKYKVWFLFDAVPIGSGITAAAIQASFTFDVMDVGQAAAPPENTLGGRPAGSGAIYLWAGAAIVLAVALGLGLRDFLLRRNGGKR